MKQFRILITCLLLCVNVYANAEVVGGSCGDNAQWSLDTETGVLSISGSGDMTNYEWPIHYLWSWSNPWFKYENSIKSVEIGDKITSIGTCAFLDFSSLTIVTISNSVTSIGEYAFSDCSGLTSVTIGNSVTSIGGSAFARCKGLTTVTIPNSVASIGSSAFAACNNVKELIYAEGTKTVLRTYLTSITSVTIPNSVTSIGADAFTACSGLTSVTIPNSVTSIGSSAFSGCSGLTSVIIPNSVTSIGSSAFYDCSGLKSITVNWSRPLSITDNVFSGVDYDNCVLYVPKGTSMMYMVAPVWINFKNIQEIDAPDPTPSIRGDVNGDGVVDVADITEVAKIILTGKAKEEEDLEEEW